MTSSASTSSVSASSVSTSSVSAPSPVVKRSVVIAGHKTSISLEEPFWQSFKGIATDRKTTLSELVTAIDQKRRHGNLSSAIRLFVFDHYRVRCGETVKAAAA